VFGVVTALIALLIVGWIAPLLLVLSQALWMLGFLYN
jgi:hypothetical protein